MKSSKLTYTVLNNNYMIGFTFMMAVMATVVIATVIMVTIRFGNTWKLSAYKNKNITKCKIKLLKSKLCT